MRRSGEQWQKRLVPSCMFYYLMRVKSRMLVEAEPDRKRARFARGTCGTRPFKSRGIS